MLPLADEQSVFGRMDSVTEKFDAVLTMSKVEVAEQPLLPGNGYTIGPSC
jgi:hypothetical protein